MKARISILALSLALGIAMAQTDPQQNTGTKTPAAPAEMKTTTYKGILVDMSCAGHTTASASTPDASRSSSTETAAGASPGSPSEQANSANRTAADSSSSCAVTSSSTEFGMKLDKDQQTVRFDLVGNQRAQDALKNEKSWNKNMTANKPIHVTVTGVLNGDKLIVSSIH